MPVLSYFLQERDNPGINYLVLKSIEQCYARVTVGLLNPPGHLLDIYQESTLLNKHCF